MNLLILINALLELNIRVSVQKANALYRAMGLPKLVADLDYYRSETKRLIEQNEALESSVAYYRSECQRLTDLNKSLSSTQDQDLARLRAKLTGSTHDRLVEEALASPSIIDMVARDQRIPAIKELRIITGCHLREAKDAIDDRRVTMRAQLPQWERDLLY